jgi:hypothetical protein
MLLALCLGFSLNLVAQNPLALSDLEGAWKLESWTDDGKKVPATGYMLFHGSYYSFVTNVSPRPDRLSRKPFPEMTEAEKEAYVTAFNTVHASAGTTSLAGDMLSYTQEVRRAPSATVSTDKRKVRLEGNRLIQDYRAGGARRIIIWERVSPAPGR